MLGAADVLLLSQRASVRGMSLASRLTAYFAAGRPVVAAASPGSEVAAEVRRSEAGVLVRPGRARTPWRGAARPPRGARPARRPRRGGRGLCRPRARAGGGAAALVGLRRRASAAACPASAGREHRRLKIALLTPLGEGQLGTSLALGLEQEGHEVVLVSARRLTSYNRAVRAHAAARSRSRARSPGRRRAGPPPRGRTPWWWCAAAGCARETSSAFATRRAHRW